MVKQRGYLMLMMAVMLVIIAGLGMALVQMFQSGINSTTTMVAASNAFNLAEAGIEAGANQLISDTSWCDGSFQSTATVSGVGEYHYRCVVNNATTTLSANLSAMATTIPVMSVANLASFGVLSIGSEVIYYEGISGNSLINARRGQNGSSAAAYSSATTVTQNQYMIESEAANPSLTVAPWGRVSLQEVFLLQQGAVYYAAGNGGVIFEYTGSNWINRAGGGSNALSIVIPPEPNSTYGYAAGELCTLWTRPNPNGAWSSQAIGGISSAISINGLAFTSNTLGHAVAYNATNKVAYAYTINNGTWTSRSISATTRYNFRSVSCADASNCWAVGYRPNSSGSSYTAFYARWNISNSTWTVTRWTNNTYSAFNNINIDCPTASRCMVVFDAGRYFYYNGSWSGSPSQLSFASGQNFNAVSCPDSNTCMIVGTGGRWVKCTLSNSSVSCPNPNATISGSPNLKAVHCISANDCMAVGVGTVAYRYNGSQWTPTSAINGTTSYTLNAVSGPITATGGITTAIPTVWRKP